MAFDLKIESFTKLENNIVFRLNQLNLFLLISSKSDSINTKTKHV